MIQKNKYKTRATISLETLNMEDNQFPVELTSAENWCSQRSSEVFLV